MMIIKVNKNHIRRGGRSNGWSCPIALALNSVLPKDYYAGVGQTAFAIHKRHEYKTVKDFQLPDLAVSFINKYDNYEGVEPFGLNVDGLEEFIETLREPAS